MILREILRTLERIEERLERGVVPQESGKGASDEWIQKGLDSIMSFQAGKKREASE